jgi:hypothetical protein
MYLLCYIILLSTVNYVKENICMTHGSYHSSLINFKIFFSHVNHIELHGVKLQIKMVPVATHR